MAKQKSQAPESESTNAATSEQAIVIKGTTLTFPKRYSEGHPLSAAEAATLNQTLGENLRNNFSKTLEKLQSEGKSGEEIQAAFQEYAAAYTFSGSRRVAVPVDPVAKEAHKIAKGKVLEALRGQSIDVKTVAPEKLEDFIQQVLAKYPEITKIAAERVASLKSMALDISLAAE